MCDLTVGRSTKKIQRLVQERFLSFHFVPTFRLRYSLTGKDNPTRTSSDNLRVIILSYYRVEVGLEPSLMFLGVRKDRVEPRDEGHLYKKFYIEKTLHTILKFRIWMKSG